jgi:hypothetical protein
MLFGNRAARDGRFSTRCSRPWHEDRSALGKHQTRRCQAVAMHRCFIFAYPAGGERIEKECGDTPLEGVSLERTHIVDLAQGQVPERSRVSSSPSATPSRLLNRKEVLVGGSWDF